MKDRELQDWGEVLSAVCNRPRMYASSETLNSVLDFVQGYLFAQTLLADETLPPGSRTPEKEPEWRQFNYWLAQKFDYPRNFAWYAARKYFANDEDALKAFPLLLEEFRNQKR